MYCGLFESLEMLCINLLFVEIEAVEACRWLKEAGFPQYAQMYDGMYIKSIYKWSSIIACSTANSGWNPVIKMESLN